MFCSLCIYWTSRSMIPNGCQRTHSHSVIGHIKRSASTFSCFATYTSIIIQYYHIYLWINLSKTQIKKVSNWVNDLPSVTILVSRGLSSPVIVFSLRSQWIRVVITVSYVSSLSRLFKTYSMISRCKNHQIKACKHYVSNRWFYLSQYGLVFTS